MLWPGGQCSLCDNNNRPPKLQLYFTFEVQVELEHTYMNNSETHHTRTGLMTTKLDAPICAACLNINKVSRVKYWGALAPLAPPSPGSYAYGITILYTFWLIFFQVCRSAAAFDILLSSWGSSAGKLEWFITVLFKWCISFPYFDWQERDCSNPEILFPSPSPSPSQMTSPTETSSGVHIGSYHVWLYTMCKLLVWGGSESHQH